MEKILLNENWSFGSNGARNDIVSLPHTLRLEELDVYCPLMGIYEYEKTIAFTKEDKNKRLFVYFEGVMTNCEIRLNGELIATHFGGYLPFNIDISDKAIVGDNIILVTVDNNDDDTTPPGKPTDGLDFLYYGGIYRNVYLLKKTKVYITDSADGTTTDGIKILPKKTIGGYDLDITVGIANTLKEKIDGTLTAEIVSADGIIFAQKIINISIKGNCKDKTNIEFYGLSPLEWDLDCPTLYTLKLTLSAIGNNTIIEEVFGFRCAEVKADGFYLNGVKTNLFGSNRHHQYPYLGIAASDNAQKREARLLKESGVNTLRLAHYPQSPAFLSECDKQGMLIIDCVPGWQFWGDTIWQQRLRENLIDMIRRDRNHPSVVIYEITPNETHCFKEEVDNYFREFVSMAKAELPNAILSGDALGRKNSFSIDYDIPHTGRVPSRILYRKIHKIKKKLPLMREYGDWAFGGNESTSRVKRGDGEYKMQVQAWNFQWTYNAQNQKNKLIGSLTWEAIDHNRGYFKKDPISKSGYLDIFRLKKYSYYFLKSQTKPKTAADIVLFPLIATLKDKTKIPVYSNCDKVEIWQGDKKIASKTSDTGRTVYYNFLKGKVNDAYWMTEVDHIQTSVKLCNEAKHSISCLFDGGNCSQLDYPPFTFTNLDLKGATSITLKGYIKDKEAKSYTFTEHSEAVSLDIDFSDMGLPLSPNNNDFIFVYVSAKDSNGEIDLSYNKAVKLTIKGGSAIYTDTMPCEAGIASFMLKADNGAKSVSVTAQSAAITTEKKYKL